MSGDERVEEGLQETDTALGVDQVVQGILYSLRLSLEETGTPRPIGEGPQA